MTADFSGDRIILADLAFYGYHGVFPEEATLGQRFVLDLTCGVDLSEAGRSDSLHASPSYADLYDTVKAAFEERRFNLVEAVAQHVVDRVFETFPSIEWQQIRVTKPEAPIAMVRGSAAVELHRRRDKRP